MSRAFRTAAPCLFEGVPGKARYSAAPALRRGFCKNQRTEVVRDARLFGAVHRRKAQSRLPGLPSSTRSVKQGREHAQAWAGGRGKGRSAARGKTKSSRPLQNSVPSPLTCEKKTILTLRRRLPDEEGRRAGLFHQEIASCIVVLQGIPDDSVVRSIGASLLFGEMAAADQGLGGCPSSSLIRVFFCAPRLAGSSVLFLFWGRGGKAAVQTCVGMRAWQGLLPAEAQPRLPNFSA